MDRLIKVLRNLYQAHVLIEYRLIVDLVPITHARGRSYNYQFLDLRMIYTAFTV